MRATRVGDLAGDELEAAPGRLVVEQDAERGVQVVALAVVDRDPVAVDLGHAVGRAGVERRRLGLRTSTTLPNISLDDAW